jgi:hypothetical protein
VLDSFQERYKMSTSTTQTEINMNLDTVFVYSSNPDLRGKTFDVYWTLLEGESKVMIPDDIVLHSLEKQDDAENLLTGLDAASIKNVRNSVYNVIRSRNLAEYMSQFTPEQLRANDNAVAAYNTSKGWTND